MTTITHLTARPAPGTDHTSKSRYRTVGLGLALVGLAGATVAAVGDFAAAGGIDADNGFQQTAAWTFGLSIFSFGTVKIAIAVILMGIVVRLWHRVDAVGSSLTTLHGHGATPSKAGTIDPRWGRATVSVGAPPLPLMHRMARLMWRPVLAMGAMALTVGLVGSWVWAGETPGTESFCQAAAFTQGTQFLGEALLLSGIAFLLGTVLAALREGGAEVQGRMGLPITTLSMPATAKAFIVLMMTGMMAGIAQFALYMGQIANADDPASFSAWGNWLAPFRELSLGLVLAGIVLALVTIGNVLAFQTDRVTSIIRTGA